MPNRLADETSPYLLQHRDNPVDWYPWGKEAFERARSLDRPVLLSIGYSACHWCHVMERESFEDDATARLMNEHFVNVKVDREERPDVDSLYMTAVQQMTGHGGWPMTVFLTPDGTPFYGGTYYPPEPRHGLPSFQQVLEGIHRAYSERRDDVRRSAQELREMLRSSTTLQPPAATLGGAVLDRAYELIARRFDERHGGFGGAPKFPQPMILEFLLRYWRRSGSGEALRMTERTLEMMWRGGMYDHLGGGFHRYSVDAFWLVPHFEKMLYDNALLARAYLHAHQATGEPLYREVVDDVLGFVLREMRAPDGGFYSSLDADTEGEEGRFYVWSGGEIDGVLGADEGPLFRRYFGATGSGNFEGRYILNPARSFREIAEAAGIPEQQLRDIVARGRKPLREARDRRTRPARDEKILTSWNAMMMRTFAEAARTFGSPEYLDAAVANARFLLGPLRPGGRLLRTYRDGDARIDAFLEDHALLADALISLYEATHDPEWVTAARELADTILSRFHDEESGAFYDVASDGEQLVVRPRDYYDNATPSGSSAAVTALLRLAALTGEERYREPAARALESFASLLKQAPQGFGELLCAAAFHLAPPRELAVVGPTGDERTRALLEVASGAYLPEVVTAVGEPGGTGAADVPLLEGREMVGGEPAAYVCEGFTCRRPVTTPAELAAELDARRPERAAD